MVRCLKSFFKKVRALFLLIIDLLVQKYVMYMVPPTTLSRLRKLVLHMNVAHCVFKCYGIHSSPVYRTGWFLDRTKSVIDGVLSLDDHLSRR